MAREPVPIPTAPPAPAGSRPAARDGDDDMPAVVDFSRGVRGKYSPARREADRLRRALARIRDMAGVEDPPLDAACQMQTEARRALEASPA
jgi:hypothetical protein